MKVIGHQRPGETGGLALAKDTAQALQEIIPVSVVTEDLAPLDASNDDVMQGTGCVQSGFARHVVENSRSGSSLSNDKPIYVPLAFACR
jgi:hypothetical protein